MARKKSEAGQETASLTGTAAASSAPLGTYVYFLLAANGTVLASYGAGTSSLESLLGAGWTALRETALASGGAVLVLKR